MARTYQVNGIRLAFNRVLKSIIRTRIPTTGIYVLTVRGRKSGKTYSTPVQPIEYAGERWLVSPYGETNWVRNARAAGEVTLTHRGKTERLDIHELSAQESAPILKAYFQKQPVVRPYFDVTIESTLEAFAAEAPKHPVFRLIPKPA